MFRPFRLVLLISIAKDALSYSLNISRIHRVSKLVLYTFEILYFRSQDFNFVHKFYFYAVVLNMYVASILLQIPNELTDQQCLAFN